jgi:hypothetical protein
MNNMSTSILNYLKIIYKDRAFIMVGLLGLVVGMAASAIIWESNATQELNLSPNQIKHQVNEVLSSPQIVPIETDSCNCPNVTT